jgi:hypothetical protein
MKILSKLTKIAILSFSMVLITVNSFSQDTPPDNGDPEDGVPIDGGLSLLVAAGVGYVAKKGYDKKKKSQTAVFEK